MNSNDLDDVASSKNELTSPTKEQFLIDEINDTFDDVKLKDRSDIIKPTKMNKADTFDKHLP